MAGEAGYRRRGAAGTAAGLGRDGKRWRAVMGTCGDRWKQLGRAIGNPLRPTPDLIALGATSVWPTPWIMKLLRDERSRAVLSGLAAPTIVALRPPATAPAPVALRAFAHHSPCPAPARRPTAPATAPLPPLTPPSRRTLPATPLPPLL